MTGNSGKTGLLDLLSGFWQQLQSPGNEDSDLNRAIKEMIDIADPAIRQTKRYCKILHEPVAGAIGYCASLIDLWHLRPTYHRPRAAS